MIVAPEPAPWLDGLEGEVFAPWVMRARVPAAMPTAVRAFVGRRQLADARGVPGWWIAEAALRAWAGDRTERHLRTRFALREATDRLAARRFSRRRPSQVIAPSCAAWRTFAAARSIGARCILVEDLPDLRSLHDDLDRAAAAHPDCRFLSNYRAPASVLVRQEVERALADEIWVRGRHAADRVRRSHPDAEVRALTARNVAPLERRRDAGPPRVLLAGLAAARHGSVEALAMLARLPEVELVVRAGDGTEPGALLEHPRISRAAGQAVDVVIAPAWVECHPAEVAAAVAAGIPVVATERAAGWSDVIPIAPGDVGGLTAAVERALVSSAACMPARSRS